MHILMFGVLGGNEGHTTKSCCPLRFTLLSLSRGNLKNLMPIDNSHSCVSFTAAVPSTIITRRCVLCWTLAKPWVPTVWP